MMNLKIGALIEIVRDGACLALHGVQAKVIARHERTESSAAHYHVKLLNLTDAQQMLIMANGNYGEQGLNTWLIIPDDYMDRVRVISAGKLPKMGLGKTNRLGDFPRKKVCHARA